MRNFFCKFLVTPVLILSIFTGCHPKKRTDESVEQAMQKYNKFILTMDVDSLALLYTPDGEMGKVARGRDSIRRFLEGFRKYKVLAQFSRTNLIAVMKDTALQTGLYTQKVVVPVNDTVVVKGLFTTKWVWMDSTGWHIQRMETKPIK